MSLKRILVIHPKDKSTAFLDRIKNTLIEKFDEQVHHFNIQTNDKSHNECLERIEEHPENGIIIFLGHGRSDSLYGSRGELFGTFENDLIKAEAPEKYYFNDTFINSSNIHVLKAKKIFCLACNSNSKIADYAMESGVRTFLGFGDIPTSPEEFLDDGVVNVSTEIVKAIKTELNYIIKTSLVLSITEGLTFEGLQNNIQFITNQRLTNVLVNQKNFKERYILADYLYYLKTEAKVLGDKKIKILD